MLAVLINGLPGAGKTTLAPRLAAALDLPVFSKDAIKETMADVLGSTPPGSTPPDSGPPVSGLLDDRGRSAWNHALGAAAAEVIWTLIGTSRRGAVIESPYLGHVRHFAAAGLARANVTHDHVHEIWCEVPLTLARERYETRATTRHPIHGDDQDKSTDWTLWAGFAEPLGFGTLHRIDTTAPTTDAEITALATAISTQEKPSARSPVL